MGKRNILIISVFCFILLTSLVSSVEFTIKDNYNQRETLISKISGNFVDPVLDENIYFYRYYGESKVNTAIDFDIVKIQDSYYIYSQLDKEEGNYSVEIQGVRHYEGTEITEKTISRNFSISNKTAYFYVNPGVVKTDKDFYIKVQNLRSNTITININPENNSEEFFSFFGTYEQKSERQISLSPGEVREVDFELENKTGLKTVTMSSGFTLYDIPVYSIVEEETEKEDKKEKLLNLSHNILNLSILPGNKVQKILTITNNVDRELENISLEVSGNLEKYINITDSNLESIESKESKDIGLIIKSNKSLALRGNLTLRIKNDNYTDYLDIYLNFGNQTYEPINNKTTNKTKNETTENDSNRADYSESCSELGGQKCNSSSMCTGQQTEASDGECCLGKCELKKEDSKGKLIGWIIVAVVVIFLIWFYLVRYKKAKGETNLLNIASGKKK